MTISLTLRKPTKRQVNVAAFVLAVSWCILAINNLLLTSCGGIIFTSARLSGLTYLLWLTLPWPCFIVALFLGPWWLKLAAKFAIPPFALFTLCSFIVAFDAIDQVITGTDSRYEQMWSEPIDQLTERVVYKVNPGAFSSYRILERKETKLIPGLRWIRTTSTGPYIEP